MISQEYIKKLYQTLSETEVNRLKYLKNGVELVCIKNFQTNQFTAQSFEDYYNYYNDTTADFTRGNKYIVTNLNDIQVDMRYSLKIKNLTKWKFRIFEIIDGNNSPYLFDYFCLEHEWLAMQRNERIETILE
jgi:hypothetical protein